MKRLLTVTVCVGMFLHAGANSLLAQKANGLDPQQKANGLDPQWHLHRIQAPTAWDLLRARRKVQDPIIVAVIDGGFEADHVDLFRRLRKTSEIVNGKDDDGNGYDDDVFGWSFYYCPNKQTDTERPCGGVKAVHYGDRIDHGMAVAGLVAADSLEPELEASYPARGVCPHCFVLPVVRGNTPWSLAESIRYAVRSGADVIVASLGHGNYDDDLVRDAIQFAESRGRKTLGTVLVFAAGNSGKVEYPAGHKLSIAVGATDCNNAIWKYSHKGNESGAISVFAPSGEQEHTKGGCGLLTLGRFQPTVMFGGTSGAAPLVAGVAALVLSADPTLAAKDVRNIIRQSVSVWVGDKDKKKYAGVVSACIAVATALKLESKAGELCKNQQRQ